MTELTKLEVGKSSPFPAKPMHDGGIFEADQNGFLFLIYLSGMTAKERNTLKNEIIQSRIIKEENRLLTLIRFGTSPLIFEMMFDPNRYDDNRAYDLIERTNTVFVIGIDSKNNTLQSLRYVTMPKDLRDVWNKKWNEAKSEKNFSSTYDAWYNMLCSNYNTLQLWDIGQRIGVFGR